MLLIFVQACAHIVAPEGGPKDETLPKLAQTSPKQGSAHFRGKYITLTFDKAIEINDVKSKLVITPKLAKPKKGSSYTATVRGHTVRLQLNVPLEKDTTYTFNFADAVRDVTEGNVAEAPTLTFSTGDQVDAMQVEGHVCNHMTQESASGVLVGLYRAKEKEPNYLEDLPDYFTKTDEKGNYQLKHISKGKYYVYASTNQNNTLKIDPEVDAYGFMTAPIDLTSTSAEAINLPILMSDVRPPQLQRQQTEGTYFELHFNKPMTEYSLTLAQETQADQVWSHWIANKSAIRVYNTFGLLEEDSIAAQLTVRDALGRVIEEKVTLRFEEERTIPPFECTLTPASGAAIKPEFVGTITCNKPVKEILTNHLFFTVNGQKVVSLSDQDWNINAQRDVITLKKQLPPNLLRQQKDVPASPTSDEKKDEGLTLRLEEGALVSIDEEETGTMSCAYVPKDPKAYGSIRGTITTQAPGFIVQLLNTTHEVVGEIRNQQHYRFDEIVPGNYKVRVLVLKGVNKTWEAGNILEQKLPDPVLLYKGGEKIAVLANWVIENIDFAF